MTRKVKEIRAAMSTKKGTWLGRAFLVLVSSSVIVVSGWQWQYYREEEHRTSPGILGVSNGPEDPGLDGLVDGLGLLLDNGEVAVNCLEGLLAELIGLVDVRLSVLVGSLEVALYRLAEASVGAVHNIDGLLAVRVGLEGINATGDNRVGGDVREGLGGR